MLKTADVRITVENYDYIEGTVHGTKSATFQVTAAPAPGNGSFISTGRMSIPRSGHKATLLADGKVLIVGTDRQPDLFDPDDLVFVPTGNMIDSHAQASVTALTDGRVLIAGGRDQLSPIQPFPRSSHAELFDPATGTFSSTGNLVEARSQHTATLLPDGRVLVAGGARDGGGGGAALATMERFDPRTGKFTTAGHMISERADHTATLLNDGGVLIVGGWNGHPADFADDPPWDPLFAERLDPFSDQAPTGVGVSTTRSGHAAVKLASGNVLVLGGVAGFQNVHDQPAHPTYAEVFDASAGRFSSFSMDQHVNPRGTVTLLENGWVLLVGGILDDTPLGYATLLDPETGRLVPAGSLSTPRFDHTATQLLDGRVLITGGIDVSGNGLDSAENLDAVPHFAIAAQTIGTVIISA